MLGGVERHLADRDPRDIEVEGRDLGLGLRRAGAGEGQGERDRAGGGGDGSASVGLVRFAGDSPATVWQRGGRRPRRCGDESCVTPEEAAALAARGSPPATGGRWRGRSRWSESTRAEHRAAARGAAGGAAGAGAAALRVGLTGTPGVGKSSFIEALGLTLVEARAAAGGAGGRSVLGALGRLDPRRQDPDGAAGAGARRLHPAEPEPGGARRRRRGGRGRRSGWSRPGAPRWCWSRRWASGSPRRWSPR